MRKTESATEEEHSRNLSLSLIADIYNIEIISVRTAFVFRCKIIFYFKISLSI